MHWLLKKPCLGKETAESYKLVSDLSFMEGQGVAEYLQVSRMTHGQLTLMNLPSDVANGQEMASVALMFSFYLQMEKGKMSSLLLFDLLAALDTVDQPVSNILNLK